MKIQCDVCEKQEASVFCVADEAALCQGCDNNVHHANKLASKHQRFALCHPSYKEAPLCDICKVKRAFLFCKEHRAILCRECDIPIHIANEHSQSHNRFLLTRVRISASSTAYPNPSPLSVSSSKQNFENCNSVTVSNYDHYKPNSHSYYPNNNMSSTTSSTNNQINENSSISTDYTSQDYLMEDIPGWRLEDLLDSSYAPQCKSFDYRHNETLVNPNQKGEEVSMGSFYSSEEYSRMWEFHQGPAVPSHLLPSTYHDRL